MKLQSTPASKRQELLFPTGEESYSQVQNLPESYFQNLNQENNEKQIQKRNASLASKLSSTQRPEEQAPAAFANQNFRQSMNLDNNNQNSDSPYQKRKYLLNAIKQKQESNEENGSFNGQFYASQPSIEIKFNTQNKNGRLIRTNSIDYNLSQASTRKSSTVVLPERRQSNFNFILPQLYYGNTNQPLQQNSSNKNNSEQKISRDVKLAAKATPIVRDTKKSLSMVDTTKNQYKSNNSSRQNSPFALNISEKQKNSYQLLKSRASVPFISESIGYLQNSLVLENNNNQQQLKSSAVTPIRSTAVSSYGNFNEEFIFQQRSSLNHIGSTRKSMTQFIQSKPVQGSESDTANMVVEMNSVPYNHNFTFKRKSKIFQPQQFTRSDSNIAIQNTPRRLRVEQEEGTSFSNHFTPFIDQKSSQKNNTNAILKKNQSQYENTHIQENGNNIIQDKLQNQISVIENPILEEQNTPTSLKDLEQNQSKLLLDSLTQSPPNQNNISHSLSDKKQLKQQQNKEELLSTVQKKAPRFIKTCIQKNPQYYEMILICNPDLHFDQFCDKLGKFISYCMDQKSVMLSAFNTIRMSLGFSECILTFLSDFFLENNMNKQYYNEFCVSYRDNYSKMNFKAGNLLLEIGGKKRVEAFVSTVVKKLEKHYEIQLQSKMNSIVDFFCYLLAGNKTGVEDYIKCFKHELEIYGGIVNPSMYTSQDFFRVKYLLFSELYSDKDLPWKMKILIINEFEKLRYKYFRDLHGISGSISYFELSKNILQSMCELHWMRLGFQQKKFEDRRNFLMDLLRIIIEGEDAIALKKFLEQNYVSLNSESIFMIESLVKGVLNQEKILPILTKKDFDYKFSKIKRILGLENSQNYLIQDLDSIYIEINKWIRSNNKLNKVPTELAKQYENLEYFFLLLISACDDNCIFHITDSLYAQEMLSVNLSQIQQQAKALKRVLIQIHVTANNTESNKYLADITLLISQLTRCFAEIKPH